MLLRVHEADSASVFARNAEVKFYVGHKRCIYPRTHTRGGACPFSGTTEKYLAALAVLCTPTCKQALLPTSPSRRPPFPPPAASFYALLARRQDGIGAAAGCDRGWKKVTCFLDRKMREIPIAAQLSRIPGSKNGCGVIKGGVEPFRYERGYTVLYSYPFEIFIRYCTDCQWRTGRT